MQIFRCIKNCHIKFNKLHQASCYIKFSNVLIFKMLRRIFRLKDQPRVKKYSLRWRIDKSYTRLKTSRQAGSNASRRRVQIRLERPRPSSNVDRCHTLFLTIPTLRVQIFLLVNFSSISFRVMCAKRIEHTTHGNIERRTFLTCFLHLPRNSVL